MEARTTLGGRGIPKGVMAVVASVLAALALLAVGGLGIRALSTPAAAQPKHPVAGQPAASGFGSAWSYTVRRAGTQTVEDPPPIESLARPSFREPGGSRGGPQS